MKEKENYVKLNDYITIIKGKQLNKDKMLLVEKYPVINGGTSPSGYFNQYNQEANTITISQGGASSGYVDFQKIKFWASAHCYVIKPKNQQILLNKYLYYILKNNEKTLKEQSYGAGIPALAKESILNLKINLPNINEQKEVIRILDSFTDYSQELEFELESRKKQYNFYRNKLLNLHYLTDFKIYKLKDIVDFKKGATNTIANKVSKYPIVSGGVKIQGYSNDFNRDKKSITISSSGSAEFVAFWDTPIFARDCFTVHAKEEIILQKYLFHFLKNKQNYIYSLKTTGTIPHVYPSTISDIQIFVPNLKIQQKIIDVLDNFEKICSDLNIGLPTEIDLRNKQYQYYRNKLLTFTSSTLRERERESWKNGLIKIINFVHSNSANSSNLNNNNYVKLKQYIKITVGDYIGKKDMLENGKYLVISGGVSPTGYYHNYNQESNVITIANRGSTGHVDFQKEKFWLGSNCFAIKSLNQNILLNKYLYYFLKNNENFLKNQSYGSGISLLAKESILNIKLFLPSLKIQQYIVNILDQFETLTNDLSKGLPAEIKLRNKQYQYYQNLLLTTN
ncbi:Restriction endonuclease subunit S [[Mycoplasma] cavipharyngis]|uniref:restriction endonuclease subunit S n=1 Tax=[Mycoplasma] cavipharyngis TaxID=92757 RepID=UPI0037048809